MSVIIPGITINDNINGNAIVIRKTVRVATISPATLSTDFENGDTVDGVVLSTGNRILIKNQATAIENGIYIVQASGAPLRSEDTQNGSNFASVLVQIEEGTTNADTAFMCSNDTGSDVIGTDNLTFIRFGPGDPNTVIQIFSTVFASTTATSYILLPDMITTPVAGSYLVTFSAACFTDDGSAIYNIAIFVDGSIITHSVRIIALSFLSATFQGGSLNTQAVVTVDGTQDVEIRQSRSGAGTMFVLNRSMELLKLS